MEELKPCPFCGGTNVDARTDGFGAGWYIFCQDCGVMCGYALNTVEAIKAWNRRTSDDRH